jgi:hypothetical protein
MLVFIGIRVKVTSDSREFMDSPQTYLLSEEHVHLGASVSHGKTGLSLAARHTSSLTQTYLKALAAKEQPASKSG